MDINVIEVYLVEYLTDELGVNVYGQEEDAEDGSYVVIEKLGSYVENFTRHATIALKSYGTTLLESAELNERVKNAMDDIIKKPEISFSKLNSDYNYTDTTTKKYRYQAVYDLVY
jgi:hypothetical protein|nr:MAG TPA: tail completion protein [Caudoviricetes sp.]